jgi:hypothetical protein
VHVDEAALPSATGDDMIEADRRVLEPLQRLVDLGSHFRFHGTIHQALPTSALFGLIGALISVKTTVCALWALRFSGLGTVAEVR